MHRTARTPWMILGGLVALLLGIWPPGLFSQTCSPEVRPLVVLLNSATRLQMSSRKNIRTVVNPKEGILTIRTVERDPSTILLLGTAPGITRVELEDVDGGREIREIVVQADVEYLTAQLKRAVPLANINIIPNGTNSVILTGFVSRSEDISVAQAVASNVGFQVINGLRLTGVQQVQLDVVVARVERTKARNFGFNFLQNSRNQLAGSIFPNILSTAPTQAVGVPATLLGPTAFAPVISTTPNNANLFGGIIGNGSGFLAFLQALEVEGIAKVLAQPRLVTLSGNTASFLDGGEQAVPVPAGLGQVGVQFEEFGTRLNFIPIVLGNGRIHLEVEPEVSALSAASGVAIAGATVPGRVTQRIHTTVEMETGQTFVIGGLIQRTHVASTNKVPVLGQLPFVGTLFSAKTYNESETELVVMVTPHLVDAQSACQVAKVLPGQESRKPDDFELFLEGLLEAPRGPRPVFINGRYVPAHHTGPMADLMPCAGSGDGLVPVAKGSLFLGAHGGRSCDNQTGSCAPAPAAGSLPTATVPAAPVAKPELPTALPAQKATDVPPAKMPQASKADVPVLKLPGAETRGPRTEPVKVEAAPDAPGFTPPPDKLPAAAPPGATLPPVPGTMPTLTIPSPPVTSSTEEGD